MFDKQRIFILSQKSKFIYQLMGYLSSIPRASK